MSATSWTICYALNAIFWLWVVKWGGALFLDRHILGIFFSGTHHWNEETFKFAGWIVLPLSTIFYILGLINPIFRSTRFIELL